MSRSRRRAGVVTLAFGLVAACSGTADDAATTTTTTAPPTTAPGPTTTTTPPPALDAIELDLQEIGDFDEPVAFAIRPGSPDLYIGEKAGRIRRVDVTETQSGNRYQVQRGAVLDISEEVVNQGEQGLLGLAFSSDGRRLYVHFSRAPDGDTRVVEYDVGDRADIDPGERRTLLEVEQPAANHNGGQLAIGPDGFLYIALGDGGGGGDPDGNAQNPDVVLGKILRIDPEGGQGGDGAPYAVPAGNPFAGGGGRPEIWLLGVRNPWRFSFDRATGDLWIADVGQNAWEEVDWLPATGGVDAGRGANLGWDRMEGAHEFQGENPDGGVLPVHEYGRDRGCSITGGFVYRGTAIQGLAGTYLFGDYCEAGVRGIFVQGGQVVAERTWDVPVARLTSFGEGPDGEIYVLSQEGPVWRLVPG